MDFAKTLAIKRSNGGFFLIEVGYMSSRIPLHLFVASHSLSHTIGYGDRICVLQSEPTLYEWLLHLVLRAVSFNK